MTVGEWHHQLNGDEFEQASGVGDWQGSLACYIPWSCRVGHNWVTELNWTELNLIHEGSSLRTPHLLIPSHFGVKISINEFWSNTNIQTMTFCLLPACCIRIPITSVMSDSLQPYGLAGSSWILQARVLEWVAMPFSRGSSWPRDQTHVTGLLHWQMGSLPLEPPGECTWPAPTSSQIYFLVEYKYIHSTPAAPKVWTCSSINLKI